MLQKGEILADMYPFSAIVGQEKLKQALLLCAVNPGIGGVLIKGEKGTAKSTAARGLSEVMPEIERVKGSFFNSSLAESFESNALNVSEIETEQVAVPFVNLPLGASEDRVLGNLDLEAMMAEKKKKLQPGLLAAAHRGILYIDEVNLLSDHLVDILLDVAASGINTVQREGISISHPSRFVLIGTMNPEEGNLRPQFLDRFGLMVEVSAPQNVSERTEVVRRRMDFEANAEAFNTKWSDSQKKLLAKIEHAQNLLPSVEMPEGLLTMISQLCMEWSVSSLRADIVMYKTAITLAAFDGRIVVGPDDIRQAAQLVLVHRRGKQSTRPGNPGNQTGDQVVGPPAAGPPAASPPAAGPPGAGSPAANVDPEIKSECGEGECPPDSDPAIFGVQAGKDIPDLQAYPTIPAPGWNTGRRGKAIDTPKGFQIRAEKDFLAKTIAVTETLTHAIFRNPEAIQITKDDLHQKIRSDKTGHLILFVVDASGSMAAGKRMEAVKGSVLSLLKDAYQKRDRVGVISFRGVAAEVLLEPTSSTDLAETAMENLPTGGRTPLAHAMQLAQEILTRSKNQHHIQPVLIVLSDGKANVPLSGGGDPWQQTLALASKIAEMGIQSMVLDTEKGYLRFGRAKELAAALHAECLSLDDLSSERITDTISARI